METKRASAIKSQLFGGPPATVFAILDGATVSDLLPRLASCKPEHICLYRGHLEPDMAEVAPYLAILEKDSGFTDWILSKGWGRAWGIFGATKAHLPELRKHFRRFLTVSQAGKLLYFRYYDPRVLRHYLTTCNTEESKAFFGPVSWYLLEDVESGNGRKFLLDNPLHEDRISIG